MIDVCVVNASPLIFLARGGHVGLLHEFARQIYLPSAVAKEIRRREISDAAARAIETETWIQIIDSPPIPPAIALWGLGPGESAVLTEALSRPGAHAVIDDLVARRCAASLGVTVNGTLGIVLLAKQSGRIAAARPVMEDLIRGGMFLSRLVLDRALAIVGE